MSAPADLRPLIVTDAWTPQVNGVVRTLQATGAELERQGHTVRYLTPEHFVTLPCPTYPDIRLSLNLWPRAARAIEAARPGTLHIATEGPLGFAARCWARSRGLPFTTAFHTRFPEYVHARTRVPLDWTYALLRWFHNGGRGLMVATESLAQQLDARGFRNLRRWGRGVDTTLFHPAPRGTLDLPRPVWLYVGRLAVEKNVEAFLDLDLPGTRLVVGDGPDRQRLQARSPDAVFVGAKHGSELASYYSASDCLVFPSRTDTFGLVLLEALACGTPVAAFPVSGPRDVIGDAPVGCLDEDLTRAARRALDMSRARCRAFALERSWARCAQQFRDNLVPFPADVPLGRRRVGRARPPNPA
jgi:glycosyltransferase involved in cell wall biosynthesis